MSIIHVDIPVRTESEANRREHWAVKASRARAQRGAAKAVMSQYKRLGQYKGPIRVHLVRIGVRNLDDDNLARSFKAVRDGIADALGIDDGSKRIQWTYGQERGGKGQYYVRAEVICE